jgi:hypothetical protein
MTWMLFYFLIVSPVKRPPTVSPITAGGFSNHEACMNAGARIHDYRTGTLTQVFGGHIRDDWFCVNSATGTDPRLGGAY